MDVLKEPKSQSPVRRYYFFGVLLYAAFSGKSRVRRLKRARYGPF
jgi:hypothetical protein